MHSQTAHENLMTTPNNYGVRLQQFNRVGSEAVALSYSTSEAATVAAVQ